jgi:hypothetical protein
MNRYLALTLLLTLTACDLFGVPTPDVQQRVTLSASREAGVVPFTVTFTATATPAATTFRWAIGGVVQEETANTFTTTFDSSGLYVVSVSAAGASDSLTVKAIARDAPNDGPVPDALDLTATPGGPAPWGVRYMVRPALEGVQARCREGAAFASVREGSFACLHEPGDTVQARFVQESGEVTATAEVTPDVIDNEGVAFAGRWRYRSRGTTETFEITQGDETAGRSADGRFKLFTITQREGLVAEFTLDGRTVVLTPVPEDDGRQVYEGRVYGLVLEALSENGD